MLCSTFRAVGWGEVGGAVYFVFSDYLMLAELRPNIFSLTSRATYITKDTARGNNYPVDIKVTAPIDV